MLLTITIYALCIAAGDFANRKTTFFHPVGWAGVALTAAGLLTKVLCT